MRALAEKYGKLPWMTGGLVVINVAVFLLCLFMGDNLYVMGRLSVFETIYNREYGRIFSAMFLHSDVNHIFNNMLILFFLGEMLEKQIGHFPFLLSYLLSGVGGNLLSLLHKMLSNDWSASIGASGAVFGLDGVLLAMVLLGGSRLSNVTPARVILMIVLSLYNGFTGSNIDNAAHIGGLFTGFVTAVLICAVQRKRRPEDRQAHIGERRE